MTCLAGQAGLPAGKAGAIGESIKNAGERPKVGIGLLIFKDGKVLMGRRMNAHGEGYYCGPPRNFIPTILKNIGMFLDRRFPYLLIRAN